MKGAIGSGLLAIARPFRFFGKAKDQLLRLNLDASDAGTNENSVVNRLGGFEVLPNRFNNQGLDISCRHPATNACRFCSGFALNHKPINIG